MRHSCEVLFEGLSLILHDPLLHRQSLHTVSTAEKELQSYERPQEAPEENGLHTRLFRARMSRMERGGRQAKAVQFSAAFIAGISSRRGGSVSR